MVKCTILQTATPTRLAEFAVQGSTQQALLTKLLADPILIRDMLVAGGAVSSETDKGSSTAIPQYGAAIAIYTQIMEASEELRMSSKVATQARDALWDDRSLGN